MAIGKTKYPLFCVSSHFLLILILTHPLAGVHANSVTVAEANCIAVRHIDIIGSRIRSFLLKELRVFKPTPSCLSSQDIGSILNAANGIALQHGYITTRIGLKTPQNIAESKALTLSVTDGIIRRIEYTDHQGKTLPKGQAQSLSYMFNDLQGKILNIHRIDDRIEKLNQLTLFKVSTEILPGDKAGDSILRIIRTPQKPLSLSMTYTHGLLPNTNESLNTVIGFDNLLNLNDKWQFTRNITLPDQYQQHNRTNSFNLRIPWRAQIWTFSHSLSNNSALNQTVATDIITENETKQNALGWQITLYRNTQNRLFAFTSIDHRSNEVDVNQTRSQVSSHINSAIEAGIKANHFQDKQSIDWQIKIRQGQDWFGANDDSDTTGDEPRHLFTRLNANANLIRPTFLHLLSGTFSLRTEIQYTDNVLLSHERLNYPYDASHNDDKGLFGEGNYLWQIGQNLSNQFKLKGHPRKILSGLSIKLITAGIWHQRNTQKSESIEQYNFRHEINYNYAYGWLAIGALRTAESWQIGSEEKQSQSIFLQIRY